VAKRSHGLGKKSLLWPDTIQEAKAIQLALKDKVKIIPLRKDLKFIAGVDAAFLEDKVIGVTSIFKYPELTHIEDAFAVTDIPFPYVPGFLSFREGPAIIEALKGLKIKPDIILVDGQGIAHPKGIGIASHLGVILDIPTIGCAKSRLVGEYKEPGLKKGEWAHLNFQGGIVGAVLRTRDNIRPLFVSPGNKIDLRGSIDVVLCCVLKYRIPEPLRRADSLSKKLRKESVCDN
jgi:deoxyribonuclease V